MITLLLVIGGSVLALILINRFQMGVAKALGDWRYALSRAPLPHDLYPYSNGSPCGENAGGESIPCPAIPFYACQWCPNYKGSRP